MGTRGFVGFVADGQEKIAYNHWDSYPTELGVRVLEWARKAAERPQALREAVKRLRVVDSDSKPTARDQQQLAPFADERVSTGSTDEWYVLLRKTQGDPGAMLAAGVIEDSATFPLDSLFCEWGYLIDTDGDGVLEVYRGFQHYPHDRGRFAGRDEYVKTQQSERGPGGKLAGMDVYHPVALVARYPLAALPSQEQFLADVDREGS